MVAHSHAPDPAQLRILSHLTANISKVSAPPSQAQGQQDPNQGPGLCNQTGPELVRAAHAHPPIYTHASHIPAPPHVHDHAYEIWLPYETPDAACVWHACVPMTQASVCLRVAPHISGMLSCTSPCPPCRSTHARIPPVLIMHVLHESS
jgi:hypothetical protein